MDPDGEKEVEKTVLEAENDGDHVEFEANVKLKAKIVTITEASEMCLDSMLLFQDFKSEFFPVPKVG